MHKPRVCHQKGLRTEAPDDSGQREDRELGLGSDRRHHFLDAADLVRTHFVIWKMETTGRCSQQNGCEDVRMRGWQDSLV